MQVFDLVCIDFGEVLDFFNWLVMFLVVLFGFVFDDMICDDGWCFLMIGWCIECVCFFVESIVVFFDGGSVWDVGVLEWLLELGNSGIIYCLCYLVLLQLVLVFDLFLLYEQNLYLLCFQLQVLECLLECLYEEFGVLCEWEFRILGECLCSFDLVVLESLLFGVVGFDEVFVGLV